MSRVEFLEGFDFSRHSAEGTAAYRDLVACLSPVEACALFKPDLRQGDWVRRVILKKIRSDITLHVQPCHRELLSQLEEGTTTLPGAKRTSAANALLTLAAGLPLNEEAQILARLVQSSNGRLRVQVYRRLKELPEQVCPDYLIVAWQTYRDYEAARLLLFRAPEEFLFYNLERLEAHFADNGALLSKLYLRLADSFPSSICRLQHIDPISHAYICVKKGIGLSSEYMIALYRANLMTERVGLVMWCAGQMRLWEAVLEMLKLADNPTKGIHGIG